MATIVELLQVDYKRLENIYKSYNTNDDKVRKNVEILKEWLKKQAHLPQKLPYNGFLEQMLKNNKYRIERTKERIDSYFTLKNLNLEIFKGLSKCENIKFPLQNSIGFALSPVFLENNQNLIFGYIKSTDPDLFDFEEFIKELVAFCEVFLRYNYAASVCFLVDANNFSLGHLKKIDFVKTRNLIKFFLDGYGFRITGINLLNLPSYCNPIVSLLKSISSAKMVSRIKVHDSLDDLHKEIPKDVLPKEFEGTALYTLEELSDISEKVLENQKPFLMDSINYLSNEKLRIGESKYSEEMFGIDGTFKQINLD